MHRSNRRQPNVQHPPFQYTLMSPDDPRSVRRRIREYARIGIELLAQRMVIYTSAFVLTVAYFDFFIGTIFFTLILLCEVIDLVMFRAILRQRDWSAQGIRRAMTRIYVGTVLSAVAISLFATATALQQSAESGHFMPIFMLISAAIFAAINNQHFHSVLALRLSIYVAAIIFIPAYDILSHHASLSSELWLNLFTVIFVLGFLIELARTHINSYTRMQQNQERLEQQHERTKAAYQAKNQFLATVSHELRTPLTSIKGALGIVNAGTFCEVPAPIKGPLNIAERNTRRLADLVDDLLTLQRAENGHMDLHLDRLDLGALIAETIDRFTPYAENAGVKVTTRLPDPAVWVDGDAKRIEQVVTNLLSNAAKFSDGAGEVQVTLERDNDMVRLSVTDQGIGIPPDAHDRIFEQFGQLDSSDTRSFQGTGLGLNISKRIVEAHGARLDFISELGVGSTFFVEFPEPQVHAIAAQ